jgi:hypothetical protein
MGVEEDGTQHDERRRLRCDAIIASAAGIHIPQTGFTSFDHT